MRAIIRCISVELDEMSRLGAPQDDADATTKAYVDAAIAGIPGGDNLGDHIATQNITLGDNWISNDGADNGLRVSPAGRLSIGTSIANAKLQFVNDVSTNGFDANMIRLWDNGSAVFGFGITHSILGYRSDNHVFYTNATNPSERMRLTANGRLGIGTANPLGALHVIDPSGGSLDVRSRIHIAGEGPAFFASNGDCVIFPSYGCGTIELRETNNVQNSSASARYAPRVTFHWANTNTTSLWMDSGAVVNVGPGTSSSGAIRAGSYLTGSDARIKTDITPLENALDKISRLNGVGFARIDDENARREIGLIAQDVETVYPELVHVDGEGIRSVNYAALVSPLVEAVKELKERNRALEEANDGLRADVEELRRIVSER